MRWIIYDGDVDAVCHCVEINASRDLGPNAATIVEGDTRPRGRAVDATRSSLLAE